MSKTFFPKATILSVRSLILCFLIGGFGFTTINSTKPVPTDQTAGKTEITLSYERQDGRGSNQYAVWIEDDQGKLVKTLFVTKFTAQGGWEKRPACTPIWVEKSGIANLSEQAIDGFTGATPSTGLQTYIWDGTNTTGEKVKPGVYTFIVEATLLNNNYAIFKGEINTAGTGTVVTTTPEYRKEIDTHTNMVTNVSARFIP